MAPITNATPSVTLYFIVPYAFRETTTAGQEVQLAFSAGLNDL